MSPEWDRFVIAIKLNKECSRATKSESEVLCSGKWYNRKWGAQNRAGNANAGQGKPDKMLLMQAQENGAVLDEKELLFLAGEQGNTFDADVDNQ
ncbi:hypothetical protein Tco_0436035 [Tanacetum coccineum]